MLSYNNQPHKNKSRNLFDYETYMFAQIKLFSGYPNLTD